MPSVIIELKPIKKTELKRGVRIFYKNEGGDFFKDARLDITYKRSKDPNGKVTSCNISMSLRLDYNDNTQGVMKYPIEELPGFPERIMSYMLNEISSEVVEYPIRYCFSLSDTDGNNRHLILDELSTVCEELISELLYRDKWRAELIDIGLTTQTIENQIRRQKNKRKWILANRFSKLGKPPIAKNQGPITREA